MSAKRRWEVWKRRDGTPYLSWGTKQRPVESETLVSTFYSANWLTAQWDAFGTEPEIDDGVEPLVNVLHLFSGCMITSACHGHPERDDDCAVIGMTFDDPLCFKTFFAALRQLDTPEDLLWFVRVDEERTLDIPPDALALELVLHDEDGIPSHDLLHVFARRLLTTSGLRGVPQAVWPWHRQGHVN